MLSVSNWCDFTHMGPVPRFPTGLRSKLNAKSLCSSEQYLRGLSGTRSPCTLRFCNETGSSCGASHPLLTLTLNFNDSFKKAL